MTLQDRQIQLQDLCARVPYHPKGHVVNSCNGAECDEWLTCATFTMFTNIMNNTRLYLRPMSSMTEEECDMVEEILGDKCIFDFMSNGDIVLKQGRFSQNKLAKLHDYYNSIHVDYQGLIPKGLALEAPEGMYNL